jgi:hypothetical protein
MTERQLLGDHHFNLPGITLLSRAQAIEYCQTRLGIGPNEYGVGYWREEKFYRNVFRAAGVTLQRIDRYESPNHVLFFAETISKMCSQLEGNLWPDLRPELARRMRNRMRKVAELYVHASRQLPRIESQPELVAQACDAIVSRLLADVFRLVGVKEISGTL